MVSTEGGEVGRVIFEEAAEGPQQVQILFFGFKRPKKQACTAIRPQPIPHHIPASPGRCHS